MPSSLPSPNRLLEKWNPCAPDIVKTDVTRRGCSRSSIANPTVASSSDANPKTSLHSATRQTSRRAVLPRKLHSETTLHTSQEGSQSVVVGRAIQAKESLTCERPCSSFQVWLPLVGCPLPSSLWASFPDGGSTVQEEDAILLGKTSSDDARPRGT